MKIRAKKSLGQHFLNSRHVLDQIISAANIKKDETVLEIGPGTGFLTRALLNVSANVIAVEKDDICYEKLKDEFASEMDRGHLDLVHGDILNLRKWQVEGVAHETPVTENFVTGHEQGSTFSATLTDRISTFKEKICDGNYTLVANIPYYITGAILESFLEYAPRPNRMVLLVQREVAERIIARDGKESILSIAVKAFGTPKIVARVPRGAFTPPPTVESAILSIENISDGNFTSQSTDARRFFDIVRAGFAHKRKYLRRNLETIAPTEVLDRAFEELKLDKKVRAEDLKLEDWLQIARKLS